MLGLFVAEVVVAFVAKAALAAVELNDFHQQLAGPIPQVSRRTVPDTLSSCRWHCCWWVWQLMGLCLTSVARQRWMLWS